MHVLTGCRWMILILPSSLKSYGKESSGMFSLNVRPRHGKECNRKDSQCRSCYQAVAQLTNGWISCNYNDSFGRPWQLVMPLWPPFGCSLSNASDGLCSRNIYGTPWALIGTSCIGSCTATNQRDTPGNICGRISLSWSTVRILFRSVNIKVLIKRMSIIDGTKTSATWVHTRQPEPYLGLMLRSLWWASTLTISQRSKHSKTPRINTPVVGKPKKAPTASRSSFFRMLGILTSRWLTLLLVPDCLFVVALFMKIGLGLLCGQLELCGFFREFNNWGRFGCLTVSPVSPLSWHLRVVFGLGSCFVLVVCFPLCCFCFASAKDSY